MSDLGPAPQGDPAAIEGNAAVLSRIGVELGRMADRLGGLGRPPGWDGAGAMTLHQTLGLQPDRVREVADALLTCGAALQRHAQALAESQVMHRLAGHTMAADPVGAARLAGRAREQAETSARTLTAVLARAAGEAPERPSFLRRFIDGVRSANAEITLGAWEVTLEIAKLTRTVMNPARVATDPMGLFGDQWSFLKSTGSAVADPVGLVKAVVDWDTWRTNPARAAGHLAPDVALALATAGSVTAAKAATAEARAVAVPQEQAQRIVADTQTRAALAQQRQNTFLLQSWKQGAGLNRGAWSGGGGVSLNPFYNAYSEAYHVNVVQRAQAIDRTVLAVNEKVGGEVVGFDKRVKELDSLKRSLATEMLKVRPPDKPHDLVVKDVARYTIVLPEGRYTDGSQAVVGELHQRGLHFEGMKNAWADDERYRGLNMTWLDPQTGVPFELQLHTPASWEATVKTHPAYEEMRLPDTTPERKADLTAWIRSEYEKATVPDGITSFVHKDQLHPEPVVPPHVPSPVADAVTGAQVSAGLAVMSREAGADTGGTPTPLRPGWVVVPPRAAP